MKHDGQTATIMDLEVMVTKPNEEGNYYRIKFSDGYDVQIDDSVFERV